MTAHRHLRASAVMTTALFAAVLSGTAPARAEDPLLVTYGIDAPAAEGDHDHRQIVYFSVPDGYAGPLHMRVFDPDAGGRYDTIFGNSWPVEGDTNTRFAIFGGDGAFVPPHDPRGTGDETNLEAGTLVTETVFGDDRALDDTWHTLAALDPAAGALVDGRRVFRLLIEGLSGDDGNLYDLALSSSASENVAIEGGRLFGFVPTVRVPRENIATELRFTVPADATALGIHQFDASGGDVAFSTNFRSVPVDASGQGAWRETDIPLDRWDRGRPGAVTVEGGGEIPNDVTLYVTDQDGTLVPIDLVPRLQPANTRPVAVVSMAARNCTMVAFSAGLSSDADGDALSYTWRFEDGRVLEGADISRTWLEPGTYDARLEVTDDSGLVANGAAQDFEVFVKRQPVAIGAAAPVVARGVPVTFDGTASWSEGFDIENHVWTFPDGSKAVGGIVEHVFETPGVYTVGLRVDDATPHPCNWATTEVTVTVNAQPVAQAGADRLVAVGEAVSFDGTASADPDGEIVSHEWDFGDGAHASGDLVSHAYESPGIYRVELEVRDGTGVENEARTDTLTVVVNAPPEADAGDDRVIALGDVVTFDATASRDGDGSLVGYAWMFGDGTSATGAIVQHAYEAAGTYEVTLTVDDGTGVANAQDADTAAVRVNARPQAEAGPEQRVSVGEVVHLDGSASRDEDGDPLEHVWNLGDGAWADGAVVDHSYGAPGSYLARLTVTDPTGVANASDTDAVRIIVNAQPVARAGADLTVEAGQLIPFDGSGSSDADGNIVRYEWAFGDGGTSAKPQPVHSYARPGHYEATLTVTDDSTTDTSVARDTLTVTVTDPANVTPVADAGEDRTVIVGESIAFDASGSADPDGNLIGFSWDFGDGTHAEGPTPVYAYPRPGAYDVTLTVRDDSGLANDLHADTLEVTVLDRPNAAPVAIAGSDRAVAVGEIVAFDGSSSADPDGNLVAFDWAFGDGAAAIGPRVDHAYAAPGTYTVSLGVRDDSGLANQADDDELTVFVNAPPVAEAGDTQLVTIGLVNFDGTASSDADGVVVRYAWDFGDGGHGIGPRPQHVYRDPGVYEVTLVVTDDSGTSTSTASDRTTITVNAAPIADAGPDIVAAPGERLVFSGDQSLDPDGTVASYFWDFRDGTTATGPTVFHAYDEPGTYHVRLSIQDDTSQDGAVDYAQTTVFINTPPTAVAGFDRRAAPGDEITFDGAGSFDPDGEIVEYRWDFSDTGTPALGVRATRTFDRPGSYVAQLTVVDDSDATNGIDEDEISILVNHQPVAEAGRDLQTSELAVTFDATDSADPDGDPLSYVWDFGDGQTAQGARVVHVFQEGGIYGVTLDVDDGSGVSNATSRDTMTVTINRAPVADAGSSINACTNDVVAFDGSGSSDPDGGTLRYSWDFGDGTRSDLTSPTKRYEVAGIYPVTLTVRDESGLANSRHTDRISVRIDQAPVAVAGPDRLACVNLPVQFDGSASSDVDGVVNRFTWAFGDGTDGFGDRPTHIFARPGQYRVALSIEGDRFGRCEPTAFDEVLITVVEAPAATISAVEAASIGETVTFDGSASTYDKGAILAHRWDFGDGTVAEGAVVDHAYEEPGTYRVVLALDSDAAAETCRTVETYRFITVNAPPVADAGEDQVAAVEETVLFDASASSDPDGGLIGHSWDFGDGATADGVEVHHVYKAPGTYRVTLTVRDDSGTGSATATDTMTVSVNAAPVADAGEGRIGAPGEPLVFSAGASFDPDGDIAAFEWDLGDGTSAAGREVSHAYEAPGVYYVRLAVRDTSALGNAVNFTETRVVINAAPVADAGADVRTGPGDTVSLDGARSFDPDGAPLVYRWDLPDGTTRDTPAITAIFDEPGTYPVALTVTDDSGAINGSAGDEVLVTVNAEPVADAGPDRDSDELTIVFDGSGSTDADGDPLTYHWDFGDGQSRVGERVVHAYAAGGVYPVILTVDDGTGLNNARDRDAVTISINRTPVAVAGGNRRACTNDTVLFDASASSDEDGGRLRFEWDFGDGTSSDLVNPSKHFDGPGVYPVTLSVEDDSGLANARHTDRVSVRIDQAPVADGGPDILTCVNRQVRFDGTASTDLDGTVNGYSWDFGDGTGGAGDRPTHAYAQPGDYTATLTVEGDQIGQCASTATDEVRVTVIASPLARIGAPDVAPVGTAVVLSASGSEFPGGEIKGFSWDFGDGTGATGETVEHVFEAAGVYKVVLSLESDAHVEDCRIVDADHFIIVNAPPLADAGDDRFAVVDEQLLFDASGSSDPDSGIVDYAWDFGDGDTARGLQVRHTYRAAGSYDVALTVTDGTDVANNTATDIARVTVTAPPGPPIDGPLAACTGDLISLTTPPSPTADFTWLLGDGETVTGDAVDYAYDRPGRYTVTLFEDDTAAETRGTRYTTRIMHVNQPPRAAAGPDQRACPGEAVSFDATASLDPDGRLERWRWYFGDGATAEGETVQHAFTEPGTYQVRLSVEDDSGTACNISSDLLEVVVNAPPVADAGPDRSVWAGGANDVLVLDGSGSVDPDGDALDFHWELGDGTVLYGERLRHILFRGGELPVTLTVSDTSGLPCGTSTDTAVISVRERQ